jgi:hypothetical protein
MVVLESPQFEREGRWWRFMGRKRREWTRTKMGDERKKERKKGLNKEEGRWWKKERKKGRSALVLYYTIGNVQIKNGENMKKIRKRKKNQSSWKVRTLHILYCFIGWVQYMYS